MMHTGREREAYHDFQIISSIHNWRKKLLNKKVTQIEKVNSTKEAVFSKELWNKTLFVSYRETYCKIETKLENLKKLILALV